MKTKVLAILLLASLSLSLTGCFAGRSSIVASQYASTPYDIYFNGNLLCKMGDDYDCSLQTRGTSNGGILEAYLDGRRVGAVAIHRSISLASILWMPLTYGLSIFTYKAYPSEIEIPIDTYVMRSDFNNDNGKPTSVWDRPYNSSQKKTVKSIESANTDEPQAVRGEDADYSEDTAPTPRTSVWDWRLEYRHEEQA